MSDFIRLSVKTSLSQCEIFQILVESLPDMSWRMGDSDTQGLYVSGRGACYEQIQIWLDDSVADVSINLRGVICVDQERDIWRSRFIDNVMMKALIKIGELGTPAFF